MAQATERRTPSAPPRWAMRLVWLLLVAPLVAWSAVTLAGERESRPWLREGLWIDLGSRLLTSGFGADRQGGHFAAYTVDGVCHVISMRRGELVHQTIPLPMPASTQYRLTLAFADLDHDQLDDLFVMRPPFLSPFGASAEDWLTSVLIQRESGFRLAAVGTQAPVTSLGEQTLGVHLKGRDYAEASSDVSGAIPMCQLRDRQTGRISFLLEGQLAATCDFDGDSNTEIVTFTIESFSAREVTYRLYALRGRKLVRVWQATLPTNTPGEPPLMPLTGDLDADGTPELFILQPADGLVRMFRFQPEP